MGLQDRRVWYTLGYLLDTYELMVSLEEAKKQIGKEFPIQPHELYNFIDGKATLTVTQVGGVTWFVDCKLLNNRTMKVVDVRKESIIHAD